MAIQAIPELWTDQMTAQGTTRKVYFHMKVRFDDGTEVWHYYGTVAPEGIGAVQHPEVAFPSDMLNLPSASDILYTLALEVAVNLLGGVG